MNKIIFPLMPPMKGDTVAVLHDALRLLLGKGLFQISEADQAAFLESLSKEIPDSLYGRTTQKLVARFQELRQIESSGEVDEATAAALNAALDEFAASPPLGVYPWGVGSVAVPDRSGALTEILILKRGPGLLQLRIDGYPSGLTGGSIHATNAWVLSPSRQVLWHADRIERMVESAPSADRPDGPCRRLILDPIATDETGLFRVLFASHMFPLYQRLTEDHPEAMLIRPAGQDHYWGTSRGLIQNLTPTPIDISVSSVRPPPPGQPGGPIVINGIELKPGAEEESDPRVSFLVERERTFEVRVLDRGAVGQMRAGGLALFGADRTALKEIADALLAELGTNGGKGNGAAEARIVTGSVRREDGPALHGVPVRAIHQADQGAIRLGEDITDSDGRYTIRYELLPGMEAVSLCVSALGEDGRPLRQSDVIREAKPLEFVDLVVAGILAGQLFTPDGDGLAGVTLRLYRLGFGGEAERLAETVSGSEGAYTLAYDAGAGRPVLEVRGLPAEGEEIRLSKPLSGLSAVDRLRVDLVVPEALVPKIAERRRMAADLASRIGGIAALAEARETGGRSDLTILSRETGWDARLLATAARAEKLAADPAVGLPPEPLYGLVRAGLPADRIELARVTIPAVEAALSTAREAGIVALSDGEAEETLVAFRQFSRREILASAAPGAPSSYGSLIAASGLSEAAQTGFADALLSAPKGEALWQAARDRGLGETEIGRLKLQGKLAHLTGNSAPLVERLMKETEASPRELVGQDLHGPEGWKALIFEAAGVPEAEHAEPGAEALTRIDAVIPPTYAGETALERMEAYGEDMARRIRIAYPTEVLARKVEKGSFTRPDAAQPVARLLRAASGAGFVMGETPVSTFLKARPEILAGLDPAERSMAAEEAKTLQRLHQITPEDDAVPILHAMGISSAHEVTAMSEAAFVAGYAAKFRDFYGIIVDWNVPRLIHRKAQQVSSIVYSLFATTQKIDSQPQIAGMSGPLAVRVEARSELIRHLPTLESLFGSLDFAECDHCRSVLSPAAYFVDLLQFLDMPDAVWANFVAQWEARTGAPYPHRTPDGRTMTPYDVLIERRPDLPHVLLSCENTTTAMPYIDVVNEILEYVVANGRLAGSAAQDGAGLDSATLLAEPQHVIAEAYAALEEAVYPLVLPFDQPLEQMRAFLARMKIPLPELLDVFRPTDALFDPAAGYDRAAIFLESMGLSRSEIAIFADPDPLAGWFRLYGFADAGAALTEAVDAASGQRIDLNSAKALSRRLGVTYRELAQIVQTGFANPALGRLAILYKLGISIGDARNFATRQALVPLDPATLSAADRAVRDDVIAVGERVAALATRFRLDPDGLKAAVTAIPFGEVLVLADEDVGGSFDKTVLRRADGSPAKPEDFLRINLLVRLWRKLAWTLAETDRALTGFLPASAPYEPAHFAVRPLLGVLVQIAHVAEIERRLPPGRAGRLALLSFWSDLATSGAAAPYAQIFLAPAVLSSDPVFDAALGDYLSPAAIAAHGAGHVFAVERQGVAVGDALDSAAFGADPRVSLAYDPLGEVQHFAFRGLMTAADRVALAALSPSPALPPLLDAIEAQVILWDKVAGHALAIQGALGLTAAEMEVVLEAAGLTPATAPLSLPTLSLLYRTRILSRLMKRSVVDLLMLRRLSGIDPFAPIGPDPVADVAGDRPLSVTLAFLDLADALKDAGIGAAELEALLLQRLPPEAAARDQAARAALLRDLGQRIARIRIDHAIPADPSSFTDTVLAEKLGLALPADVSTRFLALIAGTAEVTVRLPVAPAARIDPALIPAGEIVAGLGWDALRQEQSLTVRGLLSDAEEAALLAAEGARLPAAARATFAALLDAAQKRADAEAQAFFAAHLATGVLDPGVESGFLDPGDAALLFLRPDPGLDAAGREARDRARRARLAERFLPFLQRRLIAQAVEEAASAAIPVDSALVRALLTDARLLSLGGGEPLTQPLTRAGEVGLSAFVGGGAAVTLPSGDTGVRGADGIRIRPAGDALVLEGFFEVPASGAWRLMVALDRAGAKGELHLPNLARPLVLSGTATADGAVLGAGPGEILRLEAGRAYRVRLVLSDLAGGEARLLIQGETLPPGPIGRLPLTPAAGYQAAEAALILAGKAAALVAGLGLDRRELTHILTHAGDFGGMSLSALPAMEQPDTPAATMLAGLMRLIAVARVKADFAGGTDGLVTIFEAEAAGAPDRLEAVIFPVIARLTGRTQAEVRATARALFPSPAFGSEIPLLRLLRGLTAVNRLGAGPGDLIAWTAIVARGTPFPRRSALARALRDAIVARLDGEAWQRLAKPVFDSLRQRQRDALVAHVGRSLGLSTQEELYEHFLIDPGMEPVVETSRIRLAGASIQLFVQRCLLNLEPKVPPSAIDAECWEWMKRYRVWEANRKIFLYPENWLEPEFRDDKSPLYDELEGALLADDVSADTVEDAFLTYLRKLDQIARLDIVAMHLEDDADPAKRVLHVIGRSFAQPHSYHYRRFSHGTWTAWDPVTVDIAGEHLAPVFWRGRLYLFWVTFRDEADARSSGPPPLSGESTLGEVKVKNLLADALAQTAARRQVAVDLHWAEYSRGSWSQPEGTPPGSSITVSVSSSFQAASTFIHVSREAETDAAGGVFIHLGGEINRAFYLAGRNSPVIATAREPRPYNPFAAGTEHAGRFGGSGPLEVTVPDRKTVDGVTTVVNTLETVFAANSPGYTILPVNSDLLPWGMPDDAAEGAANPGAVTQELSESLLDIVRLSRPVFFQDARSTFFLQPEVTETTVEEWEEWVEPPVFATPQGDGGLLGARPKLRDDWDKYRLQEERPFSLHNPKDEPRPVDWLVNAHTAVEYDGVILGPAGQLGVGIVQAAEVVPGEVAALPLAASPGSAPLATEFKIVAVAGLAPGAAGLNVVGTGGFNRLLERNLVDTAAGMIRGRPRL